jgi:hypothetical protein
VTPPHLQRQFIEDAMVPMATRLQQLMAAAGTPLTTPHAFQDRKDVLPYIPDERQMLYPSWFNTVYAQIHPQDADKKKSSSKKKVPQAVKDGIVNDIKKTFPSKRAQEAESAEFRNKFDGERSIINLMSASSPEQITGAINTLKLNTLKQIDEKIAHLIDECGKLLAEYPRCAERNDFITAYCKRINFFLEQRNSFAAFPVPGKKYPQQLMFMSAADMERVGMSEKERREHVAEAYAENAAQDWGHTIGVHHQLFFQRFLGQWFTPEHKREHQQAIHDQLQLTENLFIAANYALKTYYAESDSDSEEPEKSSGWTEQHALEIVSSARRPSLPAPRPLAPDSNQELALLHSEMSAIIRVMEARSAATLAIVRDEVHALRKLPDAERSREALMEHANTLASAQAGLEFIESELTIRFRALLDFSGKNRSPAIDKAKKWVHYALSCIRYHRFLAFSAENDARSFARYLPSIRETKASGKEREQSAASAVEAAQTSSSRTPPAAPIDAAEVAQLAAPEPKPEGESTTSEPEPGALQKRSTFQEREKKVGELTTEAKSYVDESENAFRKQRDMRTLPGENSWIETAMMHLSSAREKYEETLTAMGNLPCVHQLTPGRLNKTIGACSDKIEAFKFYLSDPISKPPEEDVLKKLEPRPGFNLRMLLNEKLFKEKGLVIFSVDFPVFNWKGYEIQRRPKSVQLHFHIPGVDSFRELFAHSKEELAEKIAWGHGKPQAETGMTAPDYIRQQMMKTEYVYSNLYSAQLILKYGPPSLSRRSSSTVSSPVSPSGDKRLRKFMV